MIAKMKKIQFLIFYKEYEEFLEKIQDAGVFHVVQKDQGINSDVDIQEKIHSVSALKTKLKKYSKIVKESKLEIIPKKNNILKGKDTFVKVESLESRSDNISQKIVSTEKEIEILKPWGDFSYNSLEKLKTSGYELRFYICQTRSFNEQWKEDYDLIEISKSSTQSYFVVLCKKESVLDIEAEVFIPGNKSFSDLNLELSDLKKKSSELKREIEHLLVENFDSMTAMVASEHKKIEFGKIKLSGEKEVDDKLLFLEAWAPEKRIDEVEVNIQKTGAYYDISDPVPGDDVPVLLTNNKFAKLFEPISNLYMMPRYTEVDLTPFFAPFFMLFFGLCLGDAGYGLLLFVGMFLLKKLKKDLKPSMKSIFSLVQLFGLSTFICGLLMGTFFGIYFFEGTAISPFMLKMKSYFYLNSSNIFTLSLILGCIQILVGMCIKAYNKAIQFGVVYSLTTIGWILFFVSVAFAFLFPSVLPMFGSIHLIFVGIAAILIFFINSPGKNPFINFGAGLWDTYNMATGVLGDVLSYVRLFALGLSGGILGNVFNSLAMAMSPDIPVIGFLVSMIILLAGHGLNLFMSGLGAFVHPVRLTFVEFYKNSGFEGGAKKYQAFEK